MIHIHYNYGPGVRGTTTQRRPKSHRKILVALSGLLYFEYHSNRNIITRLAQDKRFKEFTKPVDEAELPDYYEIIENPMDLSKIMVKIDEHQYETVDDMLQDVQLIGKVKSCAAFLVLLISHITLIHVIAIHCLKS